MIDGLVVHKLVPRFWEIQSLRHSYLLEPPPGIHSKTYAHTCMHACMHITFLYRAEQKTDGWIHSLVPFFFSVRKETQGSCTMFDY
mmetsp:Transcript_20226/g.42715  ORF Transcript_20226/g.42715 Transcript_20226/m.42715 type:complete len:86 (+) Transcript_20226:1283-1540(+)